jgi:hypothetical protein
MADGALGVRKPHELLRLLMLVVMFCALIACIIMYLLVLREPNWSITSLDASRTSVGISDMLGNLVTISGLTVPLIIAYLLLKEKDLQNSIAEKAVFYLEQNGTNVSQFRAAYLFLTDPTQKSAATDCLKSLSEFVGLGTHEGEEALSSAAQEWLLPPAKLQKNYNAYFATGADRKALELAIFWVGIPALLCLFDLYLRFYGVRGWALDLAEQFLIVTTVGANVVAYIMLLLVVRMKAEIRSQAGNEVKKVCKQVREEIAAALSRSDQLRSQTSADLTVASKDAGGGTPRGF